MGYGTGSSGGSGGGITSVNGDTGPAVTLDAADVGADASGSASAVQSNLTTHEGLSTSAHGGIATAAQGAKADTALQPNGDGSGLSGVTKPGDLGDSAALNVGTTPGTVAAGDDPRIINADAEAHAQNTDTGTSAQTFEVTDLKLKRATAPFPTRGCTFDGTTVTIVGDHEEEFADADTATFTSLQKPTAGTQMDPIIDTGGWQASSEDGQTWTLPWDWTTAFREGDVLDFSSLQDESHAPRSPTTGSGTITSISYDGSTHITIDAPITGARFGRISDRQVTQGTIVSWGATLILTDTVGGAISGQLVGATDDDNSQLRLGAAIAFTADGEGTLDFGTDISGGYGGTTIVYLRDLIGTVADTTRTISGLTLAPAPVPCLKLNGVDQYLYADDTGLPTETNPLSIAGRIKSAGSGTFFWYGQGGPGGISRIMLAVDEGTGVLIVYACGGVSYGTTPINTGDWVDFVVSAPIGEVVTIYINGTDDTAAGGTAGVGYIYANGGLYIGSGLGGDTPVACELQGLAIYGSALNSTQATAYHNNAAPEGPLRYWMFDDQTGDVAEDDSGNAFDASLINNHSNDMWALDGPLFGTNTQFTIDTAITNAISGQVVDLAVIGSWWFELVDADGNLIDLRVAGLRLKAPDTSTKRLTVNNDRSLTVADQE